MKHRLILMGAALVSFAAAPALAGDNVDPDAYYYEDSYSAYDPYYDDPYYNSYRDSYDPYYPRYRGKYRRRGKAYGSTGNQHSGDGIQNPAQQGGNRGR